MNFHQKSFLQLGAKINVGGNGYTTPTGCLLPAYRSAHAPDYVERIGRAGTKKLRANGSVKRVIKNGSICHLGHSS